MSSREDFPYTDEWYQARGLKKPETKSESIPISTDFKFDSLKMIGDVQERFKELEHKQWDWKSFYNGWIEGRADLWAELKGLKK